MKSSGWVIPFVNEWRWVESVNSGRNGIRGAWQSFEPSAFSVPGRSSTREDPPLRPTCPYYVFLLLPPSPQFFLPAIQRIARFFRRDHFRSWCSSKMLCRLQDFSILWDFFEEIEREREKERERERENVKGRGRWTKRRGKPGARTGTGPRIRRKKKRGVNDPTRDAVSLALRRARNLLPSPLLLPPSPPSPCLESAQTSAIANWYGIKAVCLAEFQPERLVQVVEKNLINANDVYEEEILLR